MSAIARSAPTDSDLVAPGQLDLLLLVVVAAAAVGLLVQRLLIDTPQTDWLLGLGLLGNALLTYNQGRKQSAVLRRRSRRRHEESPL